MKRTLRITAIFFLCLSPALASPARAENYDLFKYGSLSCDEWVRHSDLTQGETPKWFDALIKQLYQGGGYRLDIVTAFKSDQTVAWLDEYCRARPLDGLAVAGTVLINDLAARAAKK